jgi:hypothetical protein
VLDETHERFELPANAGRVVGSGSIVRMGVGSVPRRWGRKEYAAYAGPGEPCGTLTTLTTRSAAASSAR